jgi:hypothetical protein
MDLDKGTCVIWRKFLSLPVGPARPSVIPDKVHCVHSSLLVTFDFAGKEVGSILSKEE